MQRNHSCLQKLRCLARAGVLATIVLLLSHCGQTDRRLGRPGFVEKARPRSGSFASVYSIIQSANCTQCHAPNGGSAASGNGTAIDFTTSDSAYRTLTGGARVRGNGAGGACAGVQIVDSRAEQSYLPYAIFGSDADFSSPHFDKGPDCTAYPVAGHNVNFAPDEKASILAWINAGARND